MPATGNYIFVVSSLQTGQTRVNARRIADTLLSNGLWLFSSSAPHKSQLNRGDRALIYLAGPGERVFVAAVELDEPVRKATDAERNLLSDLGLTWFTLASRLADVKRFSTDVPIAPLVPELDFIGNKVYYGHYLRQAVKLISEGDFERVIQRTTFA